MQYDCKDQNTASPGRPGLLKFKCIIWGNCPTYARVRQDQSFIFSPETLQFAPQTLRNTLVSIAGLDGAFLRPIPNFYLDNFLAFLKPNAKENLEKNEEKAIKSKTTKQENKDFDWKKGTYSLDSFIFLGLDKEVASNLLVLEGNSAIYSSSIASHQTWIADGSLFCDSNIMPSEYGSVFFINNPALRTIKTFCPQWKYISSVVGQSEDSKNTSDQSSVSLNAGNLRNSVVYPMVTGVATEADPVVVMEKNGVKEIFSVGNNYYKGINPGCHWRVLKRTAVFQGEDFVVEFSVAAKAACNIVKKGNNYRLLDKFSFLDVNAVTESSVCGAYDPGDFFNPARDSSSEIIEEKKKLLDFSRQIYYAIEIGVDDPQHNYWIIISENNFPFFCHAGRSPTITCRVQEVNPSQDEEPEKTNNSKDVEKCVTESDNVGRSDSEGSSFLKEIITVENDIKNKVLRKLSTYDGASSATLLGQDKLKIAVRQHAGNIVVIFSGYEDKPWVISRKDIDLTSTPVNVPVSESQISYKTVQMLIPFGRIALMGGNRKCKFNFSPIVYNKLNDFILPQPFSVQGPLDANEAQFLWRDKGKSQDPDISVSSNLPQYTNEAGVYKEIAVKVSSSGATQEVSYNATEPDGPAEGISTYAIDVQPRAVWNYGKAPDMMKRRSKTDLKYSLESVLSLKASECVLDQGSTSSRSKLFQVAISALPGAYSFPVIDGSGDPWLLKDCVTPILYYFRLYVPPKGYIFEANPVDVSHHVLTFSDEWSETEWQELEHSGSISFLVSDGMKFGNNQSNYLYSLSSKTFYLQVSIWWENGIMPTPSDPRDRVVFTGFCHGGIVTTETNKKVLECKINDYSKILKDQQFYNSPFFDRMRDINAVYDILQMAGLRDGSDNNSTFEPSSLVRNIALSEYQGGWYAFYYNGDKIYNREYALPGSYDILQSPFLRFDDGSNFWDAIKKMSLISNKVAYFDRLGVFHFEPLPYDQEIWGGQSSSQPGWSIKDWAKLSKVDFFATPKQLSTNGVEMNRQIVGNYKVERVVQDVVNEIRVLSTSPNGEVFIAGHVNYASLEDPDTPGFIGYRKPFLQMDGIFGSADTVKWIVKNYTRMFTPPIKVSFKAIGRNKLKALDVITFQPLGSREKQPLIITSIKSEVDAASNTWYQDFDCLWLFPRQDIQWGTTNEIGLGADGSISGTVFNTN